jgi:hypothetical protein
MRSKHLGRSKARLAVFHAVYRGKKKAKSVNEISRMTGLDRVRVLQEGISDPVSLDTELTNDGGD